MRLTDEQINVMLSAVPEEEREAARQLIKSMGLDQANIESPKKVYRKPLQEYNVIVFLTCRLCGNHWERYYRMTYNPELHILYSVDLLAPPAVAKRKNEVVGTCSKCRERLGRLEKDKLIDMLIDRYFKPPIPVRLKEKPDEREKLDGKTGSTKAAKGNRKSGKNLALGSGAQSKVRSGVLVRKH